MSQECVEYLKKINLGAWINVLKKMWNFWSIRRMCTNKCVECLKYLT